MRDSESTHRNPVFARTYDVLNAGAERTLFPDHRQWLVADLDGEVLDLGIGTGAMLPYYRDRGETCRVTGIDPDPNMLELARAKADELGMAVDLVSGRAESLPFEDDRFDVVVASLVLCSVDDLDVALAEIARVLAPDGEIRFFEHVRSDDLRGRVESAVAPCWRPIAGGCRIDRRTDDLIRSRFDVVESTTLDIGNFHTFPVRRFVRGRGIIRSDDSPFA